MNFHRCMLRGFRLHRCPYWIRPSITVSDHSGNINLLFLCSQFIASHLCSHWNFLEQLCYCLCLPLLLILVYSRLSPILNELIYVPFFYMCVCVTGVLFSTKKHPRTKDLLVYLNHLWIRFMFDMIDFSQLHDQCFLKNVLVPGLPILSVHFLHGFFCMSWHMVTEYS